MPKTLPKDLLASVVVFLVAMPLCLGIAIASGAPPAAGLITGMIGGIIAGSLSGAPLQVSGPAAGLAVLIYELIQEHGIAVLGPIVLIAGLVQLLAGILKLGQVFRAISPAVIQGMLAGIGILIVGAQFHVMVDDAPRGGGLANLMAIPESFVKGIFPLDGKVHHLAALVGVLTLAVLIGWTKLAPQKLKVIPGALIAVIAGTALAQLAGMPISYVPIPENLFGAIQFPAFGDIFKLISPTLLGDALAVAFVASAESLLSVAAVDQMHSGPRANYDKELRAQGIGNILSGFCGALPMTGVIVRSSANVQAGAQTRLSAILHGVWLVALVIAFPSLLRLVPTASLAAILVFTGWKLVDIKSIRKLAGYGRMPLMIYAVTVIVIVAEDMLTGILVGLALSVFKLVHALTHVVVRVTGTPNRVDISLGGAATFVRMPKIADTLDAVPPDVAAYVHFKGLDYIDHACVDLLRGWEQKRTEKGQRVYVDWKHLMTLYKSGSPASRNVDVAVVEETVAV